MGYLPLLLIGLFAGVLSGLFGVGGGIVIVPSLVLILGYTQHAANGTSLLALLAPVGLLGVIEYYKAGKIDVSHFKLSAALAVGIFLGAFFGSRYAVNLPADTLRRAFAVFLVFVAIRLWLK